MIIGCMKNNQRLMRVTVQDRKLRVYSRKSDTGSRAAVEAAFEKYVKLHFPDTGIMGTPRKPQAGSQPPGCTLMNANRKRKLDL